VKGKAGPVITADVAATPLDATFTVAGVDLAKIPTSLGGLVSLDGSLNWDGKVAHLKAHGRGEKLKLVSGGSAAAHPVELDCTLNHDLATQTGVVTQGDVHVGKALVHATGSYNAQKPQIVLNMLVSGQDMPMSDLAAVMPSVDVVLPLGASFRGGRASVRLAVDGPVDQLATNGVISAAGVSIPGFDLGSRLSTLEKLAGIRTGPATEIQQLGTSEQSGPQGISLRNIKAFVTGVGQISGAGTISPGRRLNFKMRANLNSPGAVVATFGRSSTAGVPFTIEGTTSSPIFKADVKGIVAQELDVNRAPAAAADLLRGLLRGKKKSK
jgi:AsmA protein